MKARIVRQKRALLWGVDPAGEPAVSTIQIGQNLGNALAPIGGSFFAESFGYEAMFCGVGLFTLIAGMLLLVWHARKSHVQLVGENCR